MFADALADLFARAARGELRAIVGETYPLEQAPQAQIDLRARRTTGKLLLDPTDLDHDRDLRRSRALRGHAAARCATSATSRRARSRSRRSRALLEGRDVIGQAQTGTGKTAAFGLPIMEYVDPSEQTVQALVLTPTRELCIQVTQALRTYGARKGVDVVAVFGGAPIRTQQAQLRAGGHVVVGTVGRVLDLISRHSLMLHRLPLRGARRGRRDARPGLPRGRREDPLADARRAARRRCSARRCRRRSASSPTATCTTRR